MWKDSFFTCCCGELLVQVGHPCVRVATLLLGRVPSPQLGQRPIACEPDQTGQMFKSFDIKVRLHNA